MIVPTGTASKSTCSLGFSNDVTGNLPRSPMQVYGSDAARAANLRSFVDGKMDVLNTPVGPMLPRNTGGLAPRPAQRQRRPGLPGQHDVPRRGWVPVLWGAYANACPIKQGCLSHVVSEANCVSLRACVRAVMGGVGWGWGGGGLGC